jgi:hypothetical protein
MESGAKAGATGRLRDGLSFHTRNPVGIYIWRRSDGWMNELMDTGTNDWIIGVDTYMCGCIAR